jgi:hypothetical protein
MVVRTTKKTFYIMKHKQTISKWVLAGAAFFAFSGAAEAQTNVGVPCGCPAFGSRGAPIALSTLASGTGELTAENTVLTCDKKWLLDKKIYVPSGKTLTIQAGTVILGLDTITVPANQPALVVNRGGKIFAAGSPDCEIIFTALSDPLNGTYGISNRGKWGGVALCGKATNNIQPCNGLYGGSAGVGLLEGFGVASSLNSHGGTDDNDNSGILTNVSIRHAGAVISTGNELNGLTLGSVGRGTKIENVEVVSNDDDGYEMFGGTVDMKRTASMWCSDDNLDWDWGWRGRVQFHFTLQIDSLAPVTNKGDNGIEADNDDQRTGSSPFSDPTVYNMTMIGNGKRLNESDNSGHSAIIFKEFSRGEVYNSLFANWNNGVNFVSTTGAPSGSCTVTGATPGHTINSYNHWIANEITVACNTFVLCNDATNGNFLRVNLAAPSGSDITKFDGDGNLHPAGATPIPGFDYVYAMNTVNNSVSNQYDAIPNPALATTCNPPADGFFEAANYRGAFASFGQSWLSKYSISRVLGTTANLLPCPTDINEDGVTNNADFLLLLGQFNQSCQ